MTQDRTISKIVIGNFMACSFDLSNQLRVAYSPFSDKKESGLRIITVEDLENLRRKDRVWAIIKREGNDRKRCWDSIRNVGGDPLKNPKKYQRFCPKNE